MSIYEIPLHTLAGEDASLAPYQGQTLLIVNVASKCGLTPQYEGLEQLHERYAARGFSVLGFPCNQFMGQEPGSAEEIATFCSTTYGVTFPLFEKIEVNGEGRHPLELREVPRRSRWPGAALRAPGDARGRVPGRRHRGGAGLVDDAQQAERRAQLHVGRLKAQGRPQRGGRVVVDVPANLGVAEALAARVGERRGDQ